MMPVLCICISSYNNGRKVEILVKEILKFESPKLAVTVVDDYSSDDTMERLSKIEDGRLNIYRNNQNEGARENWYETIDHGYGQYLLHLLDRDWLRIEYLQKIIEILETENAGFGYIGKLGSFAESKNAAVERYQAGSEALKKFGFVLVHPSGFFVKREIWKAFHKKEKFFKESGYGIYPHSYLFAHFAMKHDGMLLRYPMVQIVTSYTKKSLFYQNNKECLPFWWTPKAHKMELISLTRYVSNDMNLSKDLLQSILKYRFHENLDAATISYRNAAKSSINAKHYGTKIVYVEESELVKINIRFVWEYIVFLILHCNKIMDAGFFWQLVKIGKQNMQDILAYK